MRDRIGRDKSKKDIVVGQMKDLGDVNIEVSVSKIGKRSRCIVSSISPSYGRSTLYLGEDEVRELVGLLIESLTSEGKEKPP